jgi:hypothetical protein
MYASSNNEFKQNVYGNLTGYISHTKFHSNPPSGSAAEAQIAGHNLVIKTLIL